MDPPNPVNPPSIEESMVEAPEEPSKHQTSIADLNPTESQAVPETPAQTDLPLQPAANSKLEQARHSTDVYRPPDWAMLCPAEAGYRLEVVKNGIPLPECTVILSPAPLSTSSSTGDSDEPLTKEAEELSFCLLGRQPNAFYSAHNGLNGQCTVMAHPSISRLHAVLQYGRPPLSIARTSATQTDTPGWYIQDLDSTHGTFINKRRLPPGRFVRIHVGHVIRFGASTRLYLLNGPDEDTEPENPKSWSELKQAYYARQMAKQTSMPLGISTSKEVDLGCDWGLSSEDVNTDGTTFLDSIKGAACLSYEHLYQDDPRRALRAYFEREGIEPEPEFEFVEAAFGKQHCRIELPLDSGNVTAEAIVTGKRKEAIAACALEACRLLDRMGEFDPNKNSSGPSKRVRSKTYWEENDYYSSDDDTFIDRTGQIERKRLDRIRQLGVEGEAAERAAAQLASVNAALRGDTKQVVDTLSENASKLALLAQLEKIGGEIVALEEQLKAIDEKFVPQTENPTELDELEAYMNALKSGAPSRRERMKLKSRLFTLRQTEMRLFQKAGLPQPRRRVVAAAGSILPDDETGRMARTDAAAAVRAAKRRLEETTAKSDSQSTNCPESVTERPANTRLKMDQIKRSLPGRPDSHRTQVVRMHKEDEPFVAEEDEEDEDDTNDHGNREQESTVINKKESKVNPSHENSSLSSRSVTRPNPLLSSTNGLDEPVHIGGEHDSVSVDGAPQKDIDSSPTHEHPVEFADLTTNTNSAVTVPTADDHSSTQSGCTLPKDPQDVSPTLLELPEEPNPPEPIIPHKKGKISQPASSHVTDVYESTDPDYVTWLPPSDQRGDGWTELNAKYGY